MDKHLQSIEKQLGEGRNFDFPPLHLWHPELSGDIDIRIAADGSWFHEGTLFERHLVELAEEEEGRQVVRSGDYCFPLTP